MLAAGVRPLVVERCEFSCDYFGEMSVAEATVYHIQCGYRTITLLSSRSMSAETNTDLNTV